MIAGCGGDDEKSSPKPRALTPTIAGLRACLEKADYRLEPDPHNIAVAGLRAGAKKVDVTALKVTQSQRVTGAEVPVFVFGSAEDLDEGRASIEALEPKGTRYANVLVSYGTPGTRADFRAIPGCLGAPGAP
jgi:hypothetical protein